jgi:MarR family 2-MHQ and catechol resistance regulon transcriptional repressor
MSDTRRMKSIRSRVAVTAATRPARTAPPRRSDCLACRTLVSVARQRQGLDGARCQLVFEHLDAALSVQTALHRTLAEYRLGELAFAVLVALFALDPESATPADLADYTAVSRTAITDALLRLEALQLVERARDETDRRMYHLTLTEKGRTTVNEALMSYLSAINHLARYIEPATQPDLLLAYQRLQRGAAELTA